LPLDDKPQLAIQQAKFLLNIFEQIIQFGKYQKLTPTNNKTTNLFKVNELNLISTTEKIID